MTFEDNVMNKVKTPNAINNPKNIDNSLYDELRSLRLELAKEAHVPPYMIFSDKTLMELTNFRPINLKMLLTIHGIGTVKAEQYGDQIISVMRKYGIDNDNNKNEQIIDLVPKKVSTNRNDELGNLIKELRLQKAKEENIALFMVFPNSVISQLIEVKPKSMTELLEIKGMGKARCEKYGLQIIDLIYQYESSTILNSINESIKMEQSKNVLKKNDLNFHSIDNKPELKPNETIDSNSFIEVEGNSGKKSEEIQSNFYHKLINILSRLFRLRR